MTLLIFFLFIQFENWKSRKPRRKWECDNILSWTEALKKISWLVAVIMRGSGWKAVPNFEPCFFNEIKQLSLDRHFDSIMSRGIVLCQFPSWSFNLFWICKLSNLLVFIFYSTVLEEADGYQPHLIYPEIFNNRFPRACKRTITSLCWWGNGTICIRSSLLLILRGFSTSTLFMMLDVRFFDLVII